MMTSSAFAEICFSIKSHYGATGPTGVVKKLSSTPSITQGVLGMIFGSVFAS
jgi:hypothetical protein